MLPGQGVKAALLNTQKQTQEGCQLEDIKKYGPNERIEQNSRKKELHEIEKSKLSDAEFKTVIIRLLKEFIRYFNKIFKKKKKKIQAEMNITLSEVKKKKILHREPAVEWMELRIKSMIWNTRKKLTFYQNSKKKK